MDTNEFIASLGRVIDAVTESTKREGASTTLNRAEERKVRQLFVLVIGRKPTLDDMKAINSSYGSD
jgi:hypothetical protein